MCGHLPVLHFLIQKGKAPVEAKTTGADCQHTALLAAVRGGHDPMFRWLVEVAKANIDVVDELGRRPKDLAEEGGHQAILQYLLYWEGVVVAQRRWQEEKGLARQRREEQQRATAAEEARRLKEEKEKRRAVEHEALKQERKERKQQAKLRKKAEREAAEAAVWAAEEDDEDEEQEEEAAVEAGAAGRGVGESESSTASAALALADLRLGADLEEEENLGELAHLNEEDRAAMEELFEACPRNKDFMCPISLSLLEDPVLAMDCHTYSRRFIEAHIHWCLDKGKTSTSPMVRSLCVCVWLLIHPSPHSPTCLLPTHRPRSRWTQCSCPIRK